MGNKAPTPAIKQGETVTKELLQGDALAKVCVVCGVGGPVPRPRGRLFALQRATLGSCTRQGRPCCIGCVLYCMYMVCGGAFPWRARGRGAGASGRVPHACVVFDGPLCDDVRC